jgi:ethanolamine ammonia-lyase small subunit
VSVDQAQLAALVRAVLTEVLAEAEAHAASPARAASPAHAASPAASPARAASPAPGDDDTIDSNRRVNPGLAASATPGLRGSRVRPLRPYTHAASIEALVRTTPSRILQGRAGLRYLTETYLGLRADHAIALDAVESELDAAFAEARGWLPLRTRAVDHADFLLMPDHGRRLDDASRRRVEAEADKDVDVHLIAGDGLSAHALELNGPTLVAALQAELGAAGFRVGRPLFVKFARIGVQDEIGVLTRARATVIVVGERPGLGTGDSLSIYTAYGPKLGQDNAEKDCISNVRPAGLSPAVAAKKTATILKKSFAAGGGGVRLVGGAR